MRQVSVDTPVNESKECTFQPNQDAIMEDVEEMPEKEPRKRGRRYGMPVWWMDVLG